jgi:WD40 repeat protein
VTIASRQDVASGRPAQERRTGPEAVGIKDDRFEGYSGYVYSVAFSHNSTRLASGSSNRAIKIWDASSRTCVHTLEGYSDNAR